MNRPDIIEAILKSDKVYLVYEQDGLLNRYTQNMTVEDAEAVVNDLVSLSEVTVQEDANINEVKKILNSDE
jgi:hypothetical protein